MFAASQERFDRSRHSAAFPEDAIEAALEAGKVRREEVDVVSFPWTRSMARGRKLWHVVRGLPASLAYLREAPDATVPSRMGYLGAMRSLERRIRDAGIRAPVHRVAHHHAHAVSAAAQLPYREGAVLTADGMGEWTTAAAWAVRDGRVRRIRRATYPHSPGKAYAALTQWLGFRPESDEGKTMGLAAYGDPNTPPARRARSLLTSDGDRILRVDLSRMAYQFGHARLYGDRLLDDLGPSRGPGESVEARHRDAACGIQLAAQDVIEAAARQLVADTKARHLGLAGGLFLNCALNGHLQETLAVDVHPFPVAGDAGAAWGAAAFVYRERTGRMPEPLSTLQLGTCIDDGEARSMTDAPARPLRALADSVAERIAAGQLVGIARGRAEFGPRALGARSILASPASTAIRDRLNEHKGREAWRPLAPVVRDNDDRLFMRLRPSPAMILTFRATPEGMRRIPGGIHADGTARVQTVGPHDDAFLGAVLDALDALGHVPAFLNTSLNRPGEPIVNTAAQALVAARAMRLDALVVADRVVTL